MLNSSKLRTANTQRTVLRLGCVWPSTPPTSKTKKSLNLLLAVQPQHEYNQWYYRYDMPLGGILLVHELPLTGAHSRVFVARPLGREEQRPQQITRFMVIRHSYYLEVLFYCS